jgi:hypothetical protein
VAKALQALLVLLQWLPEWVVTKDGCGGVVPSRGMRVLDVDIS